MKSALCELLNIEYPIISGAMTLVSNSDLVSAVSNAGGCGIFATGDAAQKGGIERIRNEIKRIKSLTDKPFGVNVAMISPIAKEIMDTVCEEHVSMITTGAGSPASYMEQLKNAGVKVVPVVPSKKAALKMEALGADAVVAEGMESGGFIGKETTMVLVPEVTAAVNIPVIAAGGFADGRGLAAAFALGACGIQMGTRFMVCKESPIQSIFKEAIIQQGAADAIIEGAMMKKAIPHRSIRTAAAEAVIQYEKDPEATTEEYFKRFYAGRMAINSDLDQAILGMGQTAALIHEELTAKEIIDSIMLEFNRVVKDMQRFAE